MRNHGERQTAHVYWTGGEAPGRLDYLLYLPPGYAEGEVAWPLVLFLHGAGERGSDLEAVKRHGIAKLVERQDFPSIAVSPQCPTGAYWTQLTPALAGLVDEVTASYTVDESRLYLTGLSMGGFGAWHLAVEHPDRFAAVAPICGGGLESAGFPGRVCALRDVPVWAFHGARDEVVPPRQSEALVEELRRCGGNVRLTLYPDCGHDSWTRTYEDPELMRWLLAQRRGA